jgi:hypothetical protein
MVPTLLSEASADKNILIAVLPAAGPSLPALLVLAVCETLLVIGVASAFGMLPMMALGAIMVLQGAASGAGMLFDEVTDFSRRLSRASRGARRNDGRLGAMGVGPTRKPVPHKAMPRDESEVTDTHAEPPEPKAKP